MQLAAFEARPLLAVSNYPAFGFHLEKRLFDE